MTHAQPLFRYSIIPKRLKIYINCAIQLLVMSFRQNGMGFNSFMGRFGVAMAPFILLLDEIWKELPQVVLCCVAVVGAMVARSLSETRNRCLPETIEDVEQTTAK